MLPGARRTARLLNLKSRRGLGMAVAFILATAIGCARSASAAVGAATSQEDEVCDPLADYFLGMEDYPEAIERHQVVIKENPDNALAHYHLRFAYGLTG